MTVDCPKDVRKFIVEESCVTAETGLNVTSKRRSSPGRRTPKPSAGCTSTFIPMQHNFSFVLFPAKKREEGKVESFSSVESSEQDIVERVLTLGGFFFVLPKVAHLDV